MRLNQLSVYYRIINSGLDGVLCNTLLASPKKRGAKDRNRCGSEI